MLIDEERALYIIIMPVFLEGSENLILVLT